MHLPASHAVGQPKLCAFDGSRGRTKESFECCLGIPTGNNWEAEANDVWQRELTWSNPRCCPAKWKADARPTPLATSGQAAISRPDWARQMDTFKSVHLMSVLYFFLMLFVCLLCDFCLTPIRNVCFPTKMFDPPMVCPCFVYLFFMFFMWFWSPSHTECVCVKNRNVMWWFSEPAEPRNMVFCRDRTSLSDIALWPCFLVFWMYYKHNKQETVCSQEPKTKKSREFALVLCVIKTARKK